MIHLKKRKSIKSSNMSDWIKIKVAMPQMPDTLAKQTIRDFGRQHEIYSESAGYYVSTDILRDVLGPLMKIKDFKGLDVLDLGSGTGRWLRIFHELGANSITAVEPSAAIEVSKSNTVGVKNIIFQNVTGENMTGGPYDIVYSYGVIHHIPEPGPVIKRAYDVLKPGGRIVIWLYGRENNGLYLAFVRLLRIITIRLPDRALDALCRILVPLVRAYSQLCKLLPLPLRDYMSQFVDKIDSYTLTHVIYDQLDPHFAKYYRRQEAVDLMENAGFRNLHLFHRQNYSWTVMATKPES